MKDDLMNKLVIDNVQQETVNTGYVKIIFELNGFPYRMTVSKNEDGLFEPLPVRHYNFDVEEVCELCNKNDRLDLCTAFRGKRIAFFHRIIQYPSVRLKWLYIPHVPEE